MSKLPNPDPSAILPIKELREIVRAIKAPVYQEYVRPGKDQDFMSAMHHLAEQMERIEELEVLLDEILIACLEGNGMGSHLLGKIQTTTKTMR